MLKGVLLIFMIGYFQMLLFTLRHPIVCVLKGVLLIDHDRLSSNINTYFETPSCVSVLKGVVIIDNDRWLSNIDIYFETPYCVCERVSS